MSRDDIEIEQVRARIRARTASLTENFHAIQSNVSQKVVAVKRKADVAHQIRSKPAASFAASVAAGFVLSLLMGRREKHRRHLLESREKHRQDVVKTAAGAGLVSGFLVPVGLQLARKFALHFAESRLGLSDKDGFGHNAPSSRNHKQRSFFSDFLGKHPQSHATDMGSPTQSVAARELANEPYGDAFPPREPHPARGSDPAFGSRTYYSSKGPEQN